MPVEIILPKFGFTLESADIVKWLKQEGDPVRAGDPICEVTTDKVNMEVEAPEGGTLYGFQYPEGATVPVTHVIAYVLRPGESMPPGTLENVASASAAVEDQQIEPVAQPANGDIAARPISPVARRVAQAANVPLTALRGSGPRQRIMRRDVESVLTTGGKLRATPAARHRAAELALDLRQVVGTGPRGRIQAGDVQATFEALQAAPEPPAAVAPSHAPAPEAARPADADRVIVRMTGMRHTIASRLQHSFGTAPHIFFDATIDMTDIEALRERLKARGEKLSITAIVAKACAWTLRRHPYLNATLEGDEISLWSPVNIGIAVAIPEGVLVPVVHHVDQRTLREVQSGIDDLAHRARGGSLKLSDMAGGTFTLSNLGMYGVDRFTAIINPPQVAILAVGRTVPQFVPDAHGQPVLRSRMQITLSADHRVVDGAQAGQFIADLRTVLETPALMAF